MTRSSGRHRHLKQYIIRLLQRTNPADGINQICMLPARQAVNPLFGLLYATDPQLKWRAISAMGAVVATLADAHIESARVVMRRLMWNLNDESGGIGWGSPEAMGDIMARSKALAEEFHSILISYINPAGNYIEHEILQRGVLWGLGRLAHARPALVSRIPPYLNAYLKAPDPALRGLALWIAGALRAPALRAPVKRLQKDANVISIYQDYQIKEVTLADLSRSALA